MVSSANNVLSAEDLFESCTKTIRADVVRKAMSARLKTVATALSGSMAYDHIRAQSMRASIRILLRKVFMKIKYVGINNVVSKVIKKENELKSSKPVSYVTNIINNVIRRRFEVIYNT